MNEDPQPQPPVPTPPTEVWHNEEHFAEKDQLDKRKQLILRSAIIIGSLVLLAGLGFAYYAYNTWHKQVTKTITSNTKPSSKKPTAKASLPPTASPYHGRQITIPECHASVTFPGYATSINKPAAAGITSITYADNINGDVPTYLQAQCLVSEKPSLNKKQPTTKEAEDLIKQELGEASLPQGATITVTENKVVTIKGKKAYRFAGTTFLSSSSGKTKMYTRIAIIPLSDTITLNIIIRSINGSGDQEFENFINALAF